MELLYSFLKSNKLRLFCFITFSLFLGSFYGHSQITYSGNGNTGSNGTLGDSYITFSHNATTVTGSFTKGPAIRDELTVIYISTGASGRNIIDGDVNDLSGNFSTAISSGGAFESEITFPVGFEATHAIVIGGVNSGLFQIPNAGPIGNNDLNYLGSVTGSFTKTTPNFNISFNWSDIGLTSSDNFEFVALYLTRNDSFLFNEGYGTGLPDSTNPGSGNVTFTESKRYPFFYIFDGTSWSPSSPDGVNQNGRDAAITSGVFNLTSNTTLRDVSVSPGAELNIEPSVVLNIESDLANEGIITFESDASNSAQLDELEGRSEGSGDYIIQRFIPAGDNNRRVFRFLSSPVNTTTSIRDNWQEGASSNTDDPNPGFGTHITGTLVDGTDGFDGTVSGNSSLLVFDNPTQTWSAIDNTDVNTLEVGRAYNVFIRGDRSVDLTSGSQTPTNTTLRTTGSLVTGDVDFTPDLATGDGEWSLLGNPYQSIVDFNALNFSGDINSNIIYVWKPNDATEGAYEAIDNATPLEQMIQPGQSFFVQNSATVTTPPELEFIESSKNTTGLVTDVFNNGNIGLVNLELFSNNVKLDVVKFRFESGADNKIDDFDAGKLGNPTENLASSSNNSLLSIERRDYPQNNDIVPLFINQYQNTQYEFRLNTTNLNSNISIYLIDEYLNTETLIEPNQSYSFNVDSNIPESVSTDRFSLNFENTTLGVNDNAFGNGFSLYPNPSQDGLFSIKTSGLDNNSVNVSVHNLMGQEVLNQNYDIQSNGEININAGNLRSGVYFVAINQNSKSFTTKLIIQ